MSDKFKNLAVIFLGLSVTASFVFGLGGCSIKSNLDDMHDKTSQMAATTDSMAKDSDALKALGDATYSGLRSVNGKKVRDDARACIIKAASISDKLGCALTYFYGFDFQYWKNQGSDDVAELESLKRLGVEEFFQFLTVFWGPNDHFWQDYLPLDSHTLDLYAFAATLHEISPEQETQGRKRGFTPISMLTIIQDGLKAEYLNTAHDPNKVSLAQYYTGVFKDDAIELLRKRITFLPLLAYAFFNHIERVHAFNIVVNGFFGKPWIINPNLYTTDQIDFYTLCIRRALMTRQFLNEIGLDSTPENKLYPSANIHNLYQTMLITLDRTNTNGGYLEKERLAGQFRKLSTLLFAPQAEFLKVDPANYTIP